MLEIKNLHARTDDKEILKGLNLKVNAGEVHAIKDLMVQVKVLYRKSLQDIQPTK